MFTLFVVTFFEACQSNTPDAGLAANDTQSSEEILSKVRVPISQTNRSRVKVKMIANNNKLVEVLRAQTIHPHSEYSFRNRPTTAAETKGLRFVIEAYPNRKAKVFGGNISKKIRVAIKGDNGRYLSSENGSKPVTCNRSVVGEWEVFEMHFLDPQKFTLKGNNGKYLVFETLNSPLTCTGKNEFQTIFSSRQLTKGFGIMLAKSRKFITLKANYYATASGNPQQFHSSKNGFEMRFLGKPNSRGERKISLISSSYTGLLSSENGTHPITFNRGKRKDWETFTLIPVNIAKNMYALKWRNTYLSSENGAKAMTCNRHKRDTWETFKILPY